MCRSSLGWPLQPGGFLLRRLDASHILPAGIPWCRCRGGLGYAFDRADESHEIGLPDDLQFAFCRATDCGFVERRQSGAAAGLAQRAGVQDILGQDVMDKGRTAHLCRQIDPWHVLADHTIGRNGLGCRRPGDGLGEIDLGRDRPVVLTGRRAVLQELAIDDRKLVAAAVEPQRRPLQGLGTDLGADQPHRAAGNIDRQG